MAQPTFSARVPADEFAAAWLNVSLAMANDKERPMLHKAVRCEFTSDRGLMLAATDVSLLLYAEVGDASMDDEVVAACTALDVVGSGRMLDHLRHVHALAQKAAKADESFGLVARLDLVESLHDLAGNGLRFEGMDPVCLRVRIGDEEWKLPTYEGGWVPWRPLVAEHEPFGRPAGQGLGFGVKSLAKLGKLLPPEQGDEVMLLLQPAEGTKPAAVFASTEPRTRGLLSMSATALDPSFIHAGYRDDEPTVEEADRGEHPGGIDPASGEVLRFEMGDDGELHPVEDDRGLEPDGRTLVLVPAGRDELHVDDDDVAPMQAPPWSELADDD